MLTNWEPIDYGVDKSTSLPREAFSTHLNPRTVDLRRVTPDDLDSILGRDQYFFVKDRDQLQSSIGQARYGRDLAPFLLCVLAVLAIGEQAMSYRFYSIGTTKRT